jgi:hypothetical protein
MKPYSLRRRLLLWLLLATVTLGLVALVDTWREALRTAQNGLRPIAESQLAALLDDAILLAPMAAEAAAGR